MLLLSQDPTMQMKSGECNTQSTLRKSNFGKRLLTLKYKTKIGLTFSYYTQKSKLLGVSYSPYLNSW